MTKKLVTVLKILKRIFLNGTNLAFLVFITFKSYRSKTSEIMKMEEKFNGSGKWSKISITLLMFDSF